MRSADDPSAKATRSPSRQPAGQQGAGRPALADLGVGRVQQLRRRHGHRGSVGRATMSAAMDDDTLRPRPGAARAGAPRRRADRRRHLDRLGHPRLPRAPGGLDQEPGGREDGHAAGLRVRPRAPPARLAEPPHLAHVGLGAQRGAPCPGRARASRPPRPAGDPEHRRAAPEGRHRPGADRGDPRHRPRGDLPALRRPPGGRARPRPGAGRRDGPGLRRAGRRRRRRLRWDPQVGHHQLRAEPGGRGPVPGGGGGGGVRPAAGGGLDPRRVPGRRSGAGRGAPGRVVVIVNGAPTEMDSLADVVVAGLDRRVPAGLGGRAAGYLARSSRS